MNEEVEDIDAGTEMMFDALLRDAVDLDHHQSSLRQV